MTDLRVDLTRASATDLGALYRTGQASPIDATEQVLAVARIAGERHNAVSELNEQGARAAAEASAARWRAGHPLSELDGIPVSVKDSFHVTGLARRHGSAVHEPVTSTSDSAPVRRIVAAGGIVIAKTTMPDFGMLGSGISSAYGTVTNPWNPAMTPGGSSSGAGVLLATGAGPLSLGTDIAGSVRLPAAHCGLVGFKPTQGRIGYAPASTVRSAGPLARTVDDLGLVLRVVGRPDAADIFSLPGVYESSSDRFDPAGLRVGLVTSMGIGMAPGREEADAAQAVARMFSVAGTSVEPVAIGLDGRDDRALRTVFAMRGALELHGVSAERRGLLPPSIAELIEPTYDLSALAYARALDRVEVGRETVRSALAAFDLIITPAVSVAAFAAELPAPAGAESTLAHAQFLAWFNQTGQPAGVVPLGLNEEGMPIGAQLVGQRGHDALVIAAMRWVESNTSPLPFPFIGSTSGGDE
ncbi:amidase [Subtercola endophyticus]|uniref:amidase n=1 Tax=Subtercola endophyticus TaxID=2895559 RepID=UPI001E6516F0|nr:amidase family protein [Subtercola endophyticus]UFS58613.1 hypothetical protein LQ955_16685 [Subtercola endophyticus]